MSDILRRLIQSRVAKKIGQLILIAALFLAARMFWCGTSAARTNETYTKVCSQKVMDYQYMYSFAVLTNKPAEAARITTLVLSNCYAVGISPSTVAHLIWKESRFRSNAVGHRREDGKWIESDYGLFQICIDYHSNEIKKLTNVFPDICVDHWWGMRMALMRPDVNAYFGTRLLKKRLDLNWGNMRLALTDWNHGQHSDAKSNLLHHGIGNAYEQSLSDSDRFLKQVKVYWKWKLQDVNPPLYLVKI